MTAGELRIEVVTALGVYKKGPAQLVCRRGPFYREKMAIESLLFEMPPIPGRPGSKIRGAILVLVVGRFPSLQPIRLALQIVCRIGTRLGKLYRII